MATLGITLPGFRRPGQTIFGSDIYKIDIRGPKEPIFMLEGMFPAGCAGQQGRCHRRGHCCDAGGRAERVLPEDIDRPRCFLLRRSVVADDPPCAPT
ncbi:hypothetical protein [Candidatus Skiveiella danica]|uniref:hypothetical protein n=1 Tax=Candidatus Skiveiella danica TaxID=3386177 RepID=UPI0039B8C553